jgi:membrane-associated phospholipid phosphatase
MTLRRLLAPLTPPDLVTVGFLSILASLNLLFHSRVELWFLLAPANLLVIVFIVLLAHVAEAKKTPLLINLHRWYLYPNILLIFKQLYLLVHPIHPVDYDNLLIAIDRWMFGVDPTAWLMQFSHPILTEVLQIAYSSYYLLFIILGAQVYRHHSRKEFDNVALLVVYGFYLSYLGYFLVPAVGPRFTLHEFHLIDQELPGLWFTEALRAFVNWGESVPTGHPNAIDVVQRDVFPSGHTQMSFVVVYCAFHYRIGARWVLALLVVLLVIGTVYLRYHYVIDVIAGAAFFLFTIWSGWRIITWWDRWRNGAVGPEPSSDAA